MRKTPAGCQRLAVVPRGQYWIMFKMFINDLDDGADCTFSKFVNDTPGALRRHLINVTSEGKPKDHRARLLFTGGK